MVIVGIFKFNLEIDFLIGKDGKKFKLEVSDVDEFFRAVSRYCYFSFLVIAGLLVWLF